MHLQLKSADGKLFAIEAAAAIGSITLTEAIKVCVAKKDRPVVIPLPNVHSRILSKLIIWLEYHEHNRHKNNELPMSEWDKQFLNVSNEILLKIQIAANFLGITNLFNLATKTIADRALKIVMEGMGLHKQQQQKQQHNDKDSEDYLMEVDEE